MAELGTNGNGRNGNGRVELIAENSYLKLGARIAMILGQALIGWILVTQIDQGKAVVLISAEVVEHEKRIVNIEQWRSAIESKSEGLPR
jgi:hypothetical protein